MKKEIVEIDFADKKPKKKGNLKINNLELELKLLEKKVELEKLKLEQIMADNEFPEEPQKEIKTEMKEVKTEIPFEVKKELPKLPIQEIPKKRSIFIKILLSPFLHFIIFELIFFFILYMYSPKEYYLSIGGSLLVSIILSIGSWFVFKEDKPINQKVFIPDDIQKDRIYMSSEQEQMNKCPLCNSKLIKSKVMKNETKIMQYLKCKNPNCMFQKTLEFNI